MNGANISGCTFTASIIAGGTYSISGAVSGAVTAGITVALGGTTPRTTTTDTSGNFTFAGVANGNYTITPSLAGYSFAPNNLAVTVNGANISGCTFTASAPGARPFEIISLGESALRASDRANVRFSNARGYSVTVPATAPNPLQVAVPLYIDPVTGVFDSGTVVLTIILPDGTSKEVEGALTIAAPPALVGVAPGAVTEAFLEGTVALLSSAKASLEQAAAARPSAAVLLTPALALDMESARARLSVMKLAVSGFLGGSAGESIGAVTASDGPVTEKIDAVTMKNSDRIIAAFLAQIAPAGVVQAGSSAYAEGEGYDLEFARTWYQSLASDISGKWLDWGKKTGSTVGTVTAVAGLAVALAATTPAMLAVGTTAAVVGAMGFAASTFAPAACSAFLKVGSSILLDRESSHADLMPEVLYVVENTLTQGASLWRDSWITSRGGELSAAVVGLLDDQTNFTANAVKLVVGAVAISYPPGPAPGGATYSGSFSFFFPAENIGYGCMATITIAGTVNVVVTGNGTPIDPYEGTLDVVGAITPTITFIPPKVSCQASGASFSSFEGTVFGTDGMLYGEGDGVVGPGTYYASLTAATVSSASIAGAFLLEIRTPDGTVPLSQAIALSRR